MHVSRIGTILAWYWISAIPALGLMGLVAVFDANLFWQAAAFVLAMSVSCAFSVASIIRRRKSLMAWARTPQVYFSGHRLFVNLTGLVFILFGVAIVFFTRPDAQLAQLHLGIFASIFFCIGASVMIMVNIGNEVPADASPDSWYE